MNRRKGWMKMKKMTSLKCLNANQLKFLALFFMLLDHMWATIIPGNQWLTNIGRMAFPIFAFKIVEGFYHTSNFKRYAQRLFLFALISEIPFNLFLTESFIYPFHQNVMFTLLLGLLVIKVLDIACREKTWQRGLLALVTLIALSLLATLTMVDYGGMGILTIVAFYLFRGFPGAWLGQLVSLVCLNVVFFQGLSIPLTIFGWTYDFPTQGFAVFSLIFIWLYNGQKGSRNPGLQWVAYWFYPIHLFILYALFYWR